MSSAGGAERDRSGRRAAARRLGRRDRRAREGTVTKLGEQTLRVAADGSPTPIDITFDPVTHLPAREVTVEGGSAVTIELADWRVVDGVRYAFANRATSEDVRTCTTAAIDHGAATFEPPADRRGDVRFTQPTVAVPLEISAAGELRARIDSGCECELVVMRTVAEAHHLRDLPATASSSSMTAHRATALTIGATRIATPSIVISRTATDGIMDMKPLVALIGGKLLRRYRVTLDYPDRTLWLDPP